MGCAFACSAPQSTASSLLILAGMFQDRHDAAVQLAGQLIAYQGQHPLVLGIPRGGVPMARHIAEVLHGDLDVAMARKIAHPLLPEYAIGSVDESGWTYYSPFADSVMRNPADLDVEKLRQLDVIRRRRSQYTPSRGPLDVRNRVVIVVDDGLATGATMRAALHEVRSRQPSQLVCAVPVASQESLRQIRPLVDALICVQTPSNLEAISRHYRHFPTVEDAEVIRCLRNPLHASQTQQEPHDERQATRLP